MSSATFVPWQNPLTKLIQAPGGVRVGDALKKAEQNLAEMREPCLADVDDQQDRLSQLSAAGGDNPDDEVKREIYNRSNDVYAVAGVFGLKDLGAVAFNLCELTDRLRSRGVWSRDAVEVHLRAFQLLRHADPQADHSSVLAGLERLTNKVAPLAEAAPSDQASSSEARRSA